MKAIHILCQAVHLKVYGGVYYLCFCDPGYLPERTSPYGTRNLLPDCRPGTP